MQNYDIGKQIMAYLDRPGDPRCFCYSFIASVTVISRSVNSARVSGAISTNRLLEVYIYIYIYRLSL